MQKRSQGSSGIKTEPDENIGSRALDMLKEKMKLFELEKIPQLGSQKKQLPSRYRNKSTEYQIHSNQKQPQNYSQYRISSKEKKAATANGCVYSFQTLESVKTRLSLQEAQLLDVPIIKISREKLVSDQQTSQNNISLILMEKYYQSAIKYEERKKKQIQQQQEKCAQPNVMSKITISNQAVKNYKRRLKQSRKEQMAILNKTKFETVNQSIAEYATNGNLHNFPPRLELRSRRTNFYRRNLSSL